jgi:hypothetical protein
MFVSANGSTCRPSGMSDSFGNRKVPSIYFDKGKTGGQSECLPGMASLSSDIRCAQAVALSSVHSSANLQLQAGGSAMHSKLQCHYKLPLGCDVPGLLL